MLEYLICHELTYESDLGLKAIERNLMVISKMELGEKPGRQ